MKPEGRLGFAGAAGGHLCGGRRGRAGQSDPGSDPDVSPAEQESRVSVSRAKTQGTQPRGAAVRTRGCISRQQPGGNSNWFCRRGPRLPPAVVLILLPELCNGRGTGAVRSFLASQLSSRRKYFSGGPRIGQTEVGLAELGHMPRFWPADWQGGGITSIGSGPS